MATKPKFDLAYKFKAINKAEQHGNRPAAAALRIDEKSIRDWRVLKTRGRLKVEIYNL